MTTIPGHSTLGDFKGATIAVECHYAAGGNQRVVSLPLGRFPQQVEQLLAQALEAFDRLYEATPDPSDGSLSVEGGVPDDTPEEGVIVLGPGYLVRAMAAHRPPTGDGDTAPSGEETSEEEDDAFRHVDQMAADASSTSWEDVLGRA